MLCPWQSFKGLTQGLTRRKFLSGGLLTAGATLAGSNPLAAALTPGQEEARPDSAAEPFWGDHQSGILTPLQANTYFAAFDLVATDRAAVIQLFKDWTAAAANLTQGKPAADLGKDASVPAPDSASVLGLPPSRLTITFGFGSGLFTKDGKDRYGLAKHRPAAFVDLPNFKTDQLVPGRTGGDLSVQACADDPQVAFHAIRQLARAAYDVAAIRWVQTGFTPGYKAGDTPRNLMGFKDGTNNPSIKDPAAMNKVVFVGEEGPDWMRGGSYLVARRIRIALEHWDRMNVAFQEQTVGRSKYSGAPLTGKNEFDPADYNANDKDGNPVIAENSHIRLASAGNNDGAQIFRRPYSFNDGANITAERWPPWREEMEFDAGLFFICYQRDPRTGFIKIFDKMSKFDMMNQFVTHVGGGLFAIPPGMTEGTYLGQRLFEAA